MVKFLNRNLRISKIEQLNEKYVKLIKELEESKRIALENEEKFRFMAENSIDCLWQLNKRLHFIYLSPSLYEITGFKPEEWIGTPLWEHFRKREFFRVARLAVRMLRQYKTFGYVRFQTRMLNKKNEEFPVEITSKPMVDKDGNLLGLQGSTREISERVKSEKEIIRINNELKWTNRELRAKIEEINEINKELRIAKSLAEQSDRLKTVFLHNMSHEVRTPMNGILGFAELLCEEGLDHDTYKEYAALIKDGSSRLLKIVDDVLEISLLETEPIEISGEEFSISEMIKKILEDISQLYNSKKLSYSLSTQLSAQEDIIYSDLFAVKKILSKIIDNAFKFTFSGGITIELFRSDNSIIVIVEDSGVGISPQNQKKVFDRFFKEELEFDKNIGGLGVGLSIASENIKLLGGEISLVSELGKGTKVKIIFENVYQE